MGRIGCVRRMCVSEGGELAAISPAGLASDTRHLQILRQKEEASSWSRSGRDMRSSRHWDQDRRTHTHRGEWKGMTGQPEGPRAPFTTTVTAVCVFCVCVCVCVHVCVCWRCALLSAGAESSAAQNTGWKTNDVSVRLSPNLQWHFWVELFL